MNNVKKIFAAAMILCLTFALSIMAFAEDFDAERYAEEELNAWAEKNGIGMKFEDFHITSTDDNMSDAEIEVSVRSYVEMMKSAMSNMSVEIVSRSATRSVGSYTASVESMVPAIGWGYINQDFKANVSSSKISSVTLVGSSYSTGFTLGRWEPNYSWSVISSNKQYCQIHMKGTISYLWNELNIKNACTFLDTFKASGSTLVDATYSEWPD